MKKKTWLELLKMGTTSIPMLIDGLLPVAQLGCLVGPSDVGKSTLTRQWAQQLCAGDEHILGRKTLTKQIRCLYVATEDDEISTAFFLQKNSTHIKNPNRNLEFIFGCDKTIFQEVKNFCIKEPFDLVVIDNMADIFASMGGASLNDATQVRWFLGQWNVLCQDFGATVLMVHHLRKGRELEVPTKNNLNGSQSIEAKSRFVIGNSAEPEQFFPS